MNRKDELEILIPSIRKRITEAANYQEISNGIDFSFKLPNAGTISKIKELIFQIESLIEEYQNLK